MTKVSSRPSRKEADRKPVFAWIAHHLRLLGRVSAAQAKRAFGVHPRQFRRWMDDYESQARLGNDPGSQPLKGPWGGATENPMYEATSLSHNEIEHFGSRNRDQADVFPVASGLLPSTSEALDLLDAWRAHAILARVSPRVFGDPTFLDENAEPLVVEVGEAVHPRLDGETIPILLRALSARRPVSLDYINKKGIREYRTFSPHRFIFAQGRYHVRGYDDLRQRCLDLNPARAFSARILPEDAPYRGPELDTEWAKKLVLSFSVLRSVRENEEHWQSLCQTFPLDKEGTLKIETRKAMAYYVRLHLERYALRDKNGTLLKAFFEKS